MKKIRLFTVPNILTLFNLFFGMTAIVLSLRFGDLRTAFWFIIAAALFDFLDGFAARMLKSYSEVGKQLDSLSDMVSFGVAPSAILYMMYLGGAGIEWCPFGVYITFLVALFSALRLAKFNIDEEQKEEFIGLPTPACAIFVASAGYLYADKVFTIAPYWILIVSVLFAWLLISPIRMFSLKFKTFSFGQNALRYIFLICSAITVIILKVSAVPFIIGGYIIISTVRHFAFPKR